MAKPYIHSFQKGSLCHESDSFVYLGASQTNKQTNKQQTGKSDTFQRESFQTVWPEISVEKQPTFKNTQYPLKNSCLV
jgi:hypothetical protein